MRIRFKAVMPDGEWGVIEVWDGAEVRPVKNDLVRLDSGRRVRAVETEVLDRDVLTVYVADAELPEPPRTVQ